ncbi:hypothetical protein [Agrobacterium pusense]|uniref:hypothetical protein n=1 Tax=Agrobacterium pusense TaxID=648995 RepID=UPI000D1BED4C|nr:hypothetical protein [Agrobacterium pusense]
MTDIPDDIMRAARKVVVEDLGMDSPGLLQTSYIDCIAEAILDERERSRQLLSEAEKSGAEARAKAVEDVLSALTAHELYQYRPKAFQGFIEYARSALQSEER